MLSASEAVKTGIIAEKYGFDSLWLGDHFVDIGGPGTCDPFSVLAVLACKTRRIALCTGVTDVLRSHPARIAHCMATIKELSHGRVGLGVGSGEAMNIVPFGIQWDKDPKERIQRLREAIEVIRLLWRSSRRRNANYQGKYYQLRHAWLAKNPTQKPYIPIYIGAFSSSRMLELIGEIGDGWFSWLVTPETYKNRRETIEKAAEISGRRTECIDNVATLYSCLMEDERTEKQVMGLMKEAILTLDYYGLRNLGFKLPLLKSDEYQHVVVSKGRSPAFTHIARQIPEKIVRKYVAIGSIEQCMKSIENLLRVGARHVAIVDVDQPRHDVSLKIYGEKIIPYFKEECKN